VGSVPGHNLVLEHLGLQKSVPGTFAARNQKICGIQLETSSHAGSSIWGRIIANRSQHHCLYKLRTRRRAAWYIRAYMDPVF
jgi:hypothetical protein